MKAEDLFPGAWVFENVRIEGGERDWKPTQVTGIDSIYVELGGLAYTEWNHTLDDIVDYVKPIPLTPEILRDWFGFENGAFKVSALTLEVYVKPLQVAIKAKVINGEMKVAASINVGEFTKMFPIKYVHQLQRLYHALTGEPLKRVDL